MWVDPLVEENAQNVTQIENAQNESLNDDNAQNVTQIENAQNESLIEMIEPQMQILALNVT